MAKAKANRQPKASPKAKQAHLPGMEPPSIPEIDQAADNFVDKRNKWQKANIPMIEARDILEAAMKKNSLKTYEYDGKIVQFIADEKIKVNVKKPEKPEKAEKIDIPASKNGDDEGDDDDGDD